MRNRHYIIVLLLTLGVLSSWLAPCTARASDERTFRSVVVSMTDGSIVEGCPDGQFFIDYQTGMVILTDLEKNDLYLDASLITGWYYRTLTEDDITTHVQGIDDDASRFTLVADGLSVTGAKADVTVYDMQGRVVTSVGKAPEIEISFGGMPPGTYIVRCGEASFKFMVR